MMAHCHMHLCLVVISLRRKPQGDYSHKLHYNYSDHHRILFSMACVVGKTIIMNNFYSRVMLIKLHMWLYSNAFYTYAVH